MVRPLLLSAFLLLSAGSALAETPAPETALGDSEAAAARLVPTELEALAPQAAEPSETVEEADESATCGQSALQTLDFTQETGYWGPHCTRPTTCIAVEPGLGFDCSCVYRCECGTCNGQPVQAYCELIENNGCFACPTSG
ncbi:MAG: hypothetical protein AAF725_12695 [Acidobacteriota bacterium]